MFFHDLGQLFVVSRPDEPGILSRKKGIDLVGGGPGEKLLIDSGLVEMSEAQLDVMPFMDQRTASLQFRPWLGEDDSFALGVAYDTRLGGAFTQQIKNPLRNPVTMPINYFAHM